MIPKISGGDIKLLCVCGLAVTLVPALAIKVFGWPWNGREWLLSGLSTLVFAGIILLAWGILFGLLRYSFRMQLK